MDIIGVLKQEESKLRRQLTAVQGAIAALNGTEKTAISPSNPRSENGRHGKNIICCGSSEHYSSCTRTVG